jgi:hypothetical protein
MENTFKSGDKSEIKNFNFIENYLSLVLNKHRNSKKLPLIE